MGFCYLGLTLYLDQLEGAGHRLLGLLGASGAGLALVPATRVLNYLFLALTVVFPDRGWHLRLRGHGGDRRPLWSRRSLVVLAGSTVLAAILWGLLGDAVHFSLRTIQKIAEAP